MTTDIATLALAVETSGVKQGAKALDELTDAGATAEKSTRKLSGAWQALMADTSSISGGVGQLVALQQQSNAMQAQMLALAQSTKQVAAAETEAAVVRERVVSRTKTAAKETADLGAANKLTAFQTQQLSYQLNDFFVQVASGGSPLTALIQQGSQLNGTFGGTGGTISAITSLLTPFRLAVGGAAGAVAVLALAYNQGSAEQDAFAKSIILTGNAAGVTVGQLNEMAKAIGGGAATQGRAAEVLAQMAGSGQIAGAQLQALTDAALRFERAGGQAVEDTVKQFAALGKDPVQASVKLNESTNFLTKALYDQIKALDAQGRSADAAAIAQQAYAQTIASRAAELEGRLGLLERGWKAVGEAASGAWDRMLNIGRPGTLQEQLAAAEKQLADAAQPRAGANPLQGDARREAIRQRVADLRMQIYMEGEAAAAQQTSAEGVKRYIDEQTKAKKDIVSEYQREADALRERMALVGMNTEADKVATEIALGKYGKLTAGQAAELQALAAEIDRRQKAIDLQKEEARARQEQSKLITDNLVKSFAETDKLKDKNTALREEIELLGQDDNARAAIERARVSSARAILEERAALLSLTEANETERAVLQQQIDLLREREELITRRQDIKNFLEPVKDLPKDAASQTYTDVRDALARAFQDTKNPVKAFAEGLGNAIFSRVTSRLADALATQLVGTSGTGGIFGTLLSAAGTLFGGGVPSGGTTGDFARFDRSLPMATGTNYVPYDGMRATLHEGEAVIPKRFNPAAGGSPVGGPRVTFNPTTIIQVDARSDQAQVQLIAAKAAADANQRQLEQLHALGVL